MKLSAEFAVLSLVLAASVQGAVLREYEAKSGNPDENLPGTVVGRNLFADDSLWQKPNNFCDRMNIVRKDGKVILSARSPERVDTGWSLMTKRQAVSPRGLGYSIGFGTQESPKQPLSGGGGNYSCAVIWYDHADKEIERDEFQLRVRTTSRERRVMFGSVPLAAQSYAIQFGFDRPDVFADVVITLDSLDFSILPRETDENWIVKPEPEAPRVRLVSRSPSPEPFEELKIEITSQKPVDPQSVSIKVDHRDITAKCKIEKDVWVYRPTEKWTEWIHPIEISLVDPESGDQLVSKKVFYRGKDPSTPKATLRKDGVTLVDGKPFFPIGLFGVCKREFNGHNYDKAMADLAAAGVNLVQNYSDYRSKELLDAAQKNGLKVWVQAYDVDRQFFQETRHHPAVLSWYVGDDTSMHDTPFAVYDRTDRVRAVDTTRLVAQADVMNSGDSVSSYRAFVKTTDVFMPEVYPCSQADVVPDPNCVKVAIRDVECFKKDVAEAGDGKPHAVWPIIQYFMGWNAWKRYPTREELFAMTFASIAQGAQGVTFYTYGGFQIPEKKKFDYGVTQTPEIWGNFTNLTSRLAFLAPALVEPTPLQPRCSDPNVSILLKRRGCEAYLIAVNTTVEPRTLSVDFGALADWTEGEVLWEDRTIRLTDGRLSDDLACFGVHVYRFVRPDVTYVAHQGEESLAPSHTKAAYDLAVKHGLERVKLDVQRTKDGVLVTQHDPTLKSTYGWDVKIAETTYAEMLKHKAKPYRTGYANETISTFKEGLERGKKMKDGIWIDFKAYDEALVEQTLKECREAGVPDDKIIIATWCWPALVYCHRHHPNIRRVAHTFIMKVEGGYTTNNGPKGRVYASEKDLVAELLRQKSELELFGFNLPHVVRNYKTRYHTSEYVLRAVKKSGAWISIWFVDDEFTGEQYRAWGADNFVTAWKERTLRGFGDDPQRRKNICWEEFNLEW